MILEFDIGNSRIKWRQYDEIGARTVSLGHAADVEELKAALEVEQAPVMARLCSVRRDDAAGQLQAWVRQRWRVDTAIARVDRHCGGVSNRYADPQKLGVDRWLAMLAAFQRAGSACVIVDAGTALTVDAVAADGSHRGGYILPGIQMAAEALQDHTAIRLTGERPDGGTAPGHSTEDAVHHGILASICSLISTTHGELVQKGGGVSLYFSGGDAALIKNGGAFEQAEIVPELVLDGLRIACPAPGSPDHQGLTPRV